MTNTTGQDLTASFKRTLTPLIVGYVVSIAARHGFHISDDQTASTITAGATMAYYVAVRYLETHSSSKFGWLLGAAKSPVYVDPPAVVTDDAGTHVVEAPEDASAVDEPVDTDPPAVDVPVVDQVLPLLPVTKPVRKSTQRPKKT